MEASYVIELITALCRLISIKTNEVIIEAKGTGVTTQSELDMQARLHKTIVPKNQFLNTPF
jgi:hypothetical protein